MLEFRPRIVADVREDKRVVQYLRMMGAEVVEEMITPGDYVVGEGYAVERKAFRDFIESIYQKRLFEQVERLREAYRGCCLVVEGSPERVYELYNPMVFWGALAKLIAETQVPVVFTADREQTAAFIYSLAKKLQEKAEAVEARYKPKSYTLDQMQRFAVQGLPGVGPKLADRLLKRFGSVRRVFTATEGELTAVEGVGRRKAMEIVRFLDAPYKPSEAWAKPTGP